MSELTMKTEGDTHIIVTRRFAAPPEAPPLYEITGIEMENFAELARLNGADSGACR